MRNLPKLSLIAGAVALGAAALASLTPAVAADMPPSPPQMQGEVQPPPAYYPPPAGQAYPPPPVAYAPPPPPVYYAYAAPPYVWPGPYYYGPAYWGGYGPRWGYGRWGHWRR